LPDISAPIKIRVGRRAIDGTRENRTADGVELALPDGIDVSRKQSLSIDESQHTAR
jgi:hypothetical protein